MSIKIISIGSYVAGKVLDNHMLSEMVDTNNQWIVERTGIETRYIAEDITTEELAYNSCKNALDKIDIDINEVGLLISSTISNDTVVPSSSFTISGKLGIENAVCFDLNAACSGFVYSLAVAKSFMESTNIKYAILVGAERLSKYVDWKDRSTCILFGDGAGCTILENTCYEKNLNKPDNKVNEEDNISDKKLALELIDSVLGGKYDQNRYLTISSKLSPKDSDSFIRMNGRQIYKFATEIGVKVIEELLLKNNIDKKNVCLIIPHQSNQRIIETLVIKSKIEIEKWFVNLEKYGNTSSASVPIALDEALGKFDFQSNKGKYIIMLAFGGGLSYGASLLKIN